LLVLAAGMGRRYGGLKQIDHFGPHGETLMDYAVYDALAAGFAEVVFIIRHSFEPEFRTEVSGKYERRVPVDYVFQELDELPPGFTAPAGRAKPWGTAHAIWCARGRLAGPFVCVNADDYYGKNAFRTAAEHFARPVPPGPLPEYCLVGYPAVRTLSAHGGVTRAICELDDQGYLLGLSERTGIERLGDTGRYVDQTGSVRVLRGDELVSMNMMGFTPAIFAQLEGHLTAFLAAELRAPADAECLLPEVVDKIVRSEAARMRVLATSAAWFGVTHPQDRAGATAIIRDMVARGEYPSPIWKDG